MLLALPHRSLCGHAPPACIACIARVQLLRSETLQTVLPAAVHRVSGVPCGAAGLAAGPLLPAIRAMLSSSRVLKVLHNGGPAAAVLWREQGVGMQHLLDVQVGRPGAALLGRGCKLLPACLVRTDYLSGKLQPRRSAGQVVARCERGPLGALYTQRQIHKACCIGSLLRI